jgi:hypothetical protein
MLRLIQTNLAATRKGDFGNGTPSRLLDISTLDALLPECRHLALQIITHQIEFLPVSVFGRMDRYFGWGQREDQPTVASVNR